MIGGSNPTHFNAANVSEPNEELRQEEEGGRAGLSLRCVEVQADHPLLPLPSLVAGSAHYALHHPGEPHSIELLVWKRADDLAVRFVRSFVRSSRLSAVPDPRCDSSPRSRFRKASST